MSDIPGGTTPDKDKQPLRSSVFFALLFAVLACGGIVWLLAAYQLGHWWVWERPGLITGDQWRSHISNAAAIVGVPVLAAALVFSYFRQKTNDSTRRITANVLELQSAQHVASEAAALRARYATAAEQLGDDKPSVRLAGVHSMVSVADSWAGPASKEDRQAAVNVLAGFFRMNSRAKGAKSRIAASAAWQALIERSTGVTGATRWEADIDLRGVLIPPGGVPKLAVTGHRFDLGGSIITCQPSEKTGITFTAIPFEGISVNGGTLSFAGATLDGCGLLFSNGTFAGGVVSLGVKADSAGQSLPSRPSVVFKRCEFTGADVRFDTSVGDGTGLDVLFEECRFTSGTINFGGAEMLESISFQYCRFEGEGAKFVSPGKRSAQEPVPVKIAGDKREEQLPEPGEGWKIMDERIPVKLEEPTSEALIPDQVDGGNKWLLKLLGSK